MRRQSSDRSSVSSRLSRYDDDSKEIVKRPQSLRSNNSRKVSREEDLGSSHHSRYSTDKRSMYDEEKASFYERCKTTYLMVFNDTKDEVTSPEELMLLLQYAGKNPTSKAVSNIWGGFRDSVTFYQFCDILKKEKPTSKKELTKAFKKIDVNGDGFISHQELQNVLTMHGEPMTKSEIKSIMDDADYNGDGKLDYHEFCDMMLMTAEKCTRLNTDQKSKDKWKTSNGNENSVGKYRSEKEQKDSGKQIFDKDRKSKLKEEEKKSIPLDEKMPPLSKKKSKRLKDSFNNDGDNSTLESNVAKVIKEPSDLNKWRYKGTKGYFCLEENGLVESHHFQLLVLEATEIFITIQAISPKYGKFCSELADSDVSVFLLQEGKQEKLIGFTEAKLEEKNCLKANIAAGSYTLMTFTSGVLLKQTREEPENQSKLLIGEGDSAKLTKGCRDSLYEIFYRSDLDGNGFLSKKEFSLFQLKASGEECNDDAWDFVTENFEMNSKEELTPDGFLKLNLMEGQEDVEELWVTVKTMGYNNGLELVKAFPFQIEVFTRKGEGALEVNEMNAGGKKIRALFDGDG